MRQWKSLTMCLHLDTIPVPQCDGRTDRQMDSIGKTVSHLACYAC